MTSKIEIVYSTTSQHKKAEIDEACASALVQMPGGNSLRVGELFQFIFRDGAPVEPLERDLEQMVRHKCISAYRNLLVPCIVEHAGLIFDDHLLENYPGGLTQPMWDALGAENFILETRGDGRRATALAVIGYCDGLNVRCFRGETRGTLVAKPRGKREFYWDTVFMPENETLTYAKISSDPSLGLKRKIALSQSIKALLAFLAYRIASGPAILFP